MRRERLALIQEQGEIAKPEVGVKRAQRLFTDASRMYSASVTAQGAYIALKLQESATGDSAFNLGRALASDNNAINSLVVTANSMHQAHNKHFQVWSSEVINVISADFAAAEVMQVFSPEELQRILDTFTSLRASNTFSEYGFRDQIHQQLQTKHDELGTVFPDDTPKDELDSIIGELPVRMRINDLAADIRAQ